MNSLILLKKIGSFEFCLRCISLGTAQASDIQQCSSGWPGACGNPVSVWMLDCGYEPHHPSKRVAPDRNRLVLLDL